MSEYTRFDLEQDIMQLYNTSEDLDLFLKAYIDGETPMTEDHVWNIVYGIKCMQVLRADKVLDGMARVFKLDQYRESDLTAFIKKKGKK
jgi:hypothetical protein